MAFQLKIQFSGLCIFAVQPAEGEEPVRMQVLLPRAEGMHLHIPVLEFDAAYMVAGSKPSKLVTQFPLRGSGSDVGGTTLDPRICAEIVRVSEAVPGKFVLPDLFKKQAQPLLAARVTLYAGQMAQVAPGVCWRWVGGAHRRMAHIAEWVVDVPDASLTWALKDFEGNELGRSVVLHPMTTSSGQNVLNVRVRHLPAESLAVESVPSNPPITAEHFGHYYPLFGVATRPLLPREPVEMDCPPKDCTHMNFKGESAFNCMLGAG